MTEIKRPLKVFLCHAHSDKNVVRSLYSRLKREGVDAWLDKEKLLPGADWEFEIRKAVREADVVVVCLSKEFNQAGFRQKEVRIALDAAMHQPDGEIFIIPARLEECENLESLSKWHWVDLFEDGGYQSLIRALRARADRIGATLRIRRGGKPIVSPPMDEESEKAEQDRLAKAAHEEQEREAAEKIAREKAEKEVAEKARLEAEELARQKAAKEKAEREAAEKAAREKAEREEAENADRERAEREESERIAKEKAERETAEKLARDKAEKDAEKKTKRDAAEKARRERGERQAAQIFALKETLSKSFTSLGSTLHKVVPFLRIAGLIVIIGALFWIGSWAILQLSPLSPTTSASMTQRPTLTITLTPKPSGSATVTSTLTETLTPTPSEPFSYTIREGDTLDSIAEKFNLGSDGVLILLDFNRVILENNGVYYIGQKLTIPPPDFKLFTPTPISLTIPRGTLVEYMLYPGDTLVGIAGKFNSKVEDIITQNKIKDPNALIAGQILQVPVNLVPALTPTLSMTPTPLPTEITDTKGIPMILIPDGKFTMGSNSNFDNEKPAHFVNLSAYYIDKFEVTNGYYNYCVQEGECSPPTDRSSTSHASYFGNPSFDNYPVIYVTWEMARSFCEWRGGRLPTEAEWEKAARGADGRNYPWGDIIQDTNANFNGLVGDPINVGKYDSGISPYGLFDMAGNVQEWVGDWYQENYYATISDGVLDPQGPLSGQERVLRSGSWDAGRNFIRTTYRFKSSPSVSFYNIGFRCAKDAP